ncbi:MAG: hypothetical protein JNL19_09620 [Burkholderiales bacterium]|nr:hypothetical protein [Burkholderiales bacterium]
MTRDRLTPACDWIRIGGIEYPLANSPLQQYFAKAGMADPFVYERDGSPIVYVDRYEIMNDLLYLRHVDGEGGLERFFPGCPHGLIAYWFDGTLEVLPRPGRRPDVARRINVRGGQVDPAPVYVPRPGDMVPPGNFYIR